jgi:hypothetical protein
MTMNDSMNIIRRLPRIAIVLLAAALMLGRLEAQQTKHVVLVVLDGVRYTETFGDPTHSNIPVIWNKLLPLGTSFTSFRNDGITWTNSSHCSILSGRRDSVKNNGTQRPSSPTVFEYFRKQTGANAEQCWVALGKTKLQMLSYGTTPGYGVAYGASVKTSASEYDDLYTFENARSVLRNHHPAITIVNFAETDELAHNNKWAEYVGAIRQADSLIGRLWNVIDSDSLLRNTTTMIVVNDHGRHTSDFTDHGDHCEGCMHIMMLMIGPDTPQGKIDSTNHWQIDIAPTVGRLLGFETPLATGKVLESGIFKGRK